MAAGGPLGRVVHFEIHVEDPARALAFYGAVFGWRAERWGEHEYWMLETGEQEHAGINGALLRRHGPPPAVGQPVNAFVCSVDVEDVDATVAAAVANGGHVARVKMAIPGVGWVAYVRDTEGNILGVYQTDRAAG